MQGFGDNKFIFILVARPRIECVCVPFVTEDITPPGPPFIAPLFRSRKEWRCRKNPALEPSRHRELSENASFGFGVLFVVE